MSNDYVYLDNAASTRVDERVWEAMNPYFFDKYAVATSEFAYGMGIEAKEVLDEARGTIASKLGAEPGEVIFTSGGTESSNLAVKGVAKKLVRDGNHLIVSKIEDFPVLNSAKALKKNGFTLTQLDVDEEGFVDLEQLKNAITNETILVSIQHANQEIGTLHDIHAIAEICADHDVLFHTDATHTFTREPFKVTRLPVDLVTLSAHTIHGPKGIGALYIRDGTPVQKLMDGGFQEKNLRAGIQNVPGAVGFAKAVELVTEGENERVQKMRDVIIERIQSEVPDTTLNGHAEKRIPHNANITFHYVEGESITLHLDMRGFAVSTGSACFSKSLEASHVIMAIGGDHERAHGSVRFSFGRFNTMEHIEAVVEAVADVVKKLREISPLTKKREG
ncbi:MAG: cysteine desulfurase [Candidatus Korarchaeota archaeon]|nr:cysteine desulfurase [Candidatus Korarchaeota archaeon]NIU83425.1 aminotransferase class V-fold PLP-dependent enzyme [Candidatus Thorarchaeota archaeon]NIW13697.1 aminotransferase class V-fold PLP-dependent enzyme [Candidatus Thorarchaeota archaeon]NIW51796.1 aminotransferase class V-fold PLP-dependent enzyme [Candidatus Korarchaeota archaeon]